MGNDKSLLPHRKGVSFLEYAAQRLGPVTSNILLSGVSEDHALLRSDLLSQFDVVSDARPDRGPAEGITSVMRRIQHRWPDTIEYDAVLVTPVDMPDLQTSHLDSLSKEYLNQVQMLLDESLLTCRNPGPVCASFGNNRPEPLVALYPFAILPSLIQVANSEMRSLSRWLEENAHVCFRLPPEIKANVNRPQDMSAYQNRLST